MSTSELRARLTALQMERIDAAEVGLTTCEPYMRDLEEEISQTHAALVGAAVTDIAVARAELSGAQYG